MIFVLLSAAAGVLIGVAGTVAYLLWTWRDML